MKPATSLTFASATKRIEDGDPGRLEIRCVARYDSEPVFERRGRDHEIGAVIAVSRAQDPPTPRGLQFEWHNPLAIKSQYPIQPRRKRVSKVWIRCALSRNAALDFANADDAEEKFSRSLPFEPRYDVWIALPLAQFG